MATTGSKVLQKEGKSLKLEEHSLIFEGDLNLFDNLDNKIEINPAPCSLPHEQQLQDWTAPFHIRNEYRIYLAGNDLKGRPIWIVELGRWDIRRLVEADEQEIFEKYIVQNIHRALKSIRDRNTPENPVQGALVIIDMSLLKMNQIFHLPTVSFMIGLARKFADFIDHLEVGFFVNTNRVAETALNLVKPILWKVLSRVSIWGTNKEKWIPKIMKHCEPHQVSKEYGGTGNFVPIILE